MKNLITENTGVSLGILGTIIGAVVWISFVAANTAANTTSIQGLSQKMDSLAAMQSDVAVIRNKVENIERQLDGKGK